MVLALGTRLGPFGTLPQHGIDYWPKDAKIIQVDSDHRMLGLVKSDRRRHLRRRQGGGRSALHTSLANRKLAAAGNAASGRSAIGRKRRLGG